MSLSYIRGNKGHEDIMKSKRTGRRITCLINAILVILIDLDIEYAYRYRKGYLLHLKL